MDHQLRFTEPQLVCLHQALEAMEARLASQSSAASILRRAISAEALASLRGQMPAKVREKFSLGTEQLPLRPLDTETETA